MWRAEVAGLARKIEVARDRLPTWPADKLTVLSESPSAFYDLMPPQLVEQVPGCRACRFSSFVSHCLSLFFYLIVVTLLPHRAASTSCECASWSAEPEHQDLSQWRCGERLARCLQASTNRPPQHQPSALDSLNESA